MHLIASYNKSLRTIAVFATYVNETLVASTGAELEKKSVAKFRYELDRLLNLSNFCYTLMVKGLKMEEPPESLLPAEGGALEVRVLCSVGSPALMVCKWVANLFDLQVQAGRIRAEQVSAVQAEVSSLMDVYHKTRAVQLSPMPGQPRISHCSPYQPRFRPSSSRCSHSQVPPLHVPWPEHSTSQPSPEKQASHTHVPELRGNSVPLMHGRLQSTPIHPSSQLMQRGVSSGKPAHSPRP